MQNLEVMQIVSVAFTFHLSPELYCAHAYSDGVSHIGSALWVINIFTCFPQALQSSYSIIL